MRRWSSRRVRIAALGAVLGLAAATLTVAAPAAPAVAGTCRARNVTSGLPVSSDLQAVFDAAAAGDTIRVSGTCSGGFTIDRNLTVSREPGAPSAIVDGAGASSVLVITGTARVVLIGLRVSNGSASYGGGVRSASGLVIKHSVITGNEAVHQGGGIWVRGDLVLRDSVVQDNVAETGGGVFSRGSVKVTGDSVVRRNQAVGRGGGIVGHSPGRNTVTMSGSASVRGNTASSAGGIWCSRLRMTDQSSVSGNVVRRAWGASGGGIQAGLVLMTDRSRVAHNASPSMGGGIDTLRLRMMGKARIVRNSARLGGGVYAHWGHRNHLLVAMSGGSRIAANTATRGGGVALGRRSTGGILLQGRASVSRNIAAITGGGILLSQNCKTADIRDHARVNRNKPENIVMRCAKT